MPCKEREAIKVVLARVHAWHLAHRSLAPWRSSVARSERDVGTAFIHEHQVSTCYLACLLAPGGTGGFIAFAGTHCFFLRVQPTRRMTRLIVLVLTRMPVLASQR